MFQLASRLARSTHLTILWINQGRVESVLTNMQYDETDFNSAPQISVGGITEGLSSYSYTVCAVD